MNPTGSKKAGLIMITFGLVALAVNVIAGLERQRATIQISAGLEETAVEIESLTAMLTNPNEVSVLQSKLDVLAEELSCINWQRNSPLSPENISLMTNILLTVVGSWLITRDKLITKESNRKHLTVG